MALLQIVHAIEESLDIKPRTSHLRKWYKTEKHKDEGIDI
jgi:hypothetical protein